MLWDAEAGEYTASDLPADGMAGPQGPQGEPGKPGAGVPGGGEAGQVLAKKSGADQDTHWVTPSGGNGGVTSFNGRVGDVTPRAGDYTAQQVGALDPRMDNNQLYGKLFAKSNGETVAQVRNISLRSEREGLPASLAAGEVLLIYQET